MVVLEKKRLTMNLVGLEALARTAAFHTRDIEAQEGKDTADEEDLKKQKFISRFCAVSPNFSSGFRRVFLKTGAKLTFNKEYAEITCLQFKIRFTESKDLVFFLSMIRPYIYEIHFIETHFWRVHLIEIAEALTGKVEEVEQNGKVEKVYACINAATLLKFEKTGNDNAYGTLIEYLAPAVKRIEVDDEFAAQLRDEEFQFDYCKVKAQHRAEMYYTKSYFDINSKEHDLLNVCNLKNLVMYKIEDFNIVPLENVKKITMSLLEEEDQGDMVAGAEYLRYLAPNLQRLILAQNKALVISDPEKAFHAGRQIQQFFHDKYEELIAHCFPHINIDLRLELSLYSREDALKNKVDWFNEIKKDYPDLRNVLTEYETEAFQILIPGNKDGDSIIIRIHPHNRDYNEGIKNNFPHPAPIQIL